MSSPLVAEEKVKSYQKILLHYWNTDGRKILPWRLTADPWKILLAEVLLRKTTSSQAAAVYPTISMLSPSDILNMDEQDLINLLKPLGLFLVRAAHLKKIAKIIEEHGSESLGDPAFLAQLPGIGRYIGNSVLCFAYGMPKPSLDTNMIRVIQRVFSYQVKRSRAREDKDLWKFAESLVPKRNPREYNWAVLDLGAAVCTARNPKCLICPLLSICDFGRTALSQTP